MKIKIIRKIILLLALTLSFAPVRVFAHGENTPGPHGGSIRMPGLLHTEVLQSDIQHLRVYLLDIEFKNPVTTNSTLKVSIKGAKESKELKCSPDKEYFLCEVSDPEILNQGELIVEANREGQAGAPVSYKLPVPKP